MYGLFHRGRTTARDGALIRGITAEYALEITIDSLDVRVEPTFHHGHNGHGNDGQRDE